MKQIYKITYLATNKIYIGKVAYESFRYFGSPDINIVNEDFRKLPIETQKDYTVRKEILWESASCSDSQLAKKEAKFIKQFQSNNPDVGYNRWPKFN
ncbi:GIY-YIG nuclease family protein [Pseudomonas spirodelae]|uniref:GIY-YIG nuclease family protein n=1 Tax=Pseudomonas spirodelae TaxID=3101751 RepID=A0ABU5P4X2_9PSED|nr:hypothetical protein [Pseudomonas sp. T5W1]MEA1604691.1 hypothetical protein [Pseudomonas sp. T5W1]